MAASNILVCFRFLFYDFLKHNWDHYVLKILYSSFSSVCVCVFLSRFCHYNIMSNVPNGSLQTLALAAGHYARWFCHN